MNDKNITGRSAPSGSRLKLAEVLPLDTPLVIQMFHIYACNLSCKFCHYGLPKENRPFLTSRPKMDLDHYKKCIDDLTAFKHPIKLLRFCGTGESLLDKNLVEMIRYASHKQVAQSIELITNAVFLTKELSTALINSGLSRLRVSIYGLSSATYRELCQAEVDFDRIVDNVRFYYEENDRLGRKSTMYVKTMDCALRSKEEEAQFVELFGNYCDIYSIELVRPNVPGIDYSVWLDEERPASNALGIGLPKISVCPQPFHLLTICPDGRVVPCTCDFMFSIGDSVKQSLPEIWFGNTLRRHQHRMLGGNANAGDICAQCSIVQCRPFPEDILDAEAERLKQVYPDPDRPARSPEASAGVQALQQGGNEAWQTAL
jgi:MoaA/NifB/PqqE/SkfB family radical SAM enzyme